MPDYNDVFSLYIPTDNLDNSDNYSSSRSFRREIQQELIDFDPDTSYNEISVVNTKKFNKRK